MKMQSWRWWSALLLVPVVALLARGQEAPEPFRDALKWQPLFQGVDHVELAAKTPRLMHGHAIRIDLKAPGIEFLATPPLADKPSKTAGLKTSTFLSKHHCQVAINGSPFSPIRKEEGQGTGRRRPAVLRGTNDHEQFDQRERTAQGELTAQLMPPPGN
jgi:hypothetical protein